MRAAFLYFLVHASTADRFRQAPREAPARAASRARHTRTPRRRHRVRGLPAVVARRMLTVPGAAANERPDHRATTPPALAVADRPGPAPGTEESGARLRAADPRNPDDRRSS